MDNPFEEAHRKAKDDVDNFELNEHLYERRSNLLTMCDIATELQVRLKQDPENFDLQERFMEIKVEIRRSIRDHEHLLENYTDMNNTTAIESVKKTIELVKEEIKKWND